MNTRNSLRRSLAVVFAVVCAAFAVVPAASAERQLPAPDSFLVERLAAAKNTSIEAATRSIAIQQRAGELAAKLPRELGDDFAGVWFDIDTNSVTVATAGDRGAREAKRLAAESEILNQIRLVRFERSLDDLYAIQKRLHTAMRGTVPRGSYTSAIATQDNGLILRIGLHVSDRDAKKIRAEAARLGNVVEIEVVSRERVNPPERGCSFPFCDRPLRAGVGIRVLNADHDYDCSAGFIAANTTSKYIMTAGHCRDAGLDWDTEAPTYGYYREIGPITQAYVGYWGDMAKLRVNTSSFWHTPGLISRIANWGYNTNETVKSVRQPLLGAIYCSYGATAARQCGIWREQGVMFDADYGNLWRGDACGSAGDSGGATTEAGDVAVALSVAGPDYDCPDDWAEVRDYYDSYYTDVTIAESVLGLQVVTEPPPPTTGPAGPNATNGVAGFAFKGGDTISSGQYLNAGEYILSDDVRTLLVMQRDGNLVLYSENFRVLWHSNTQGSGATYATVQRDGNLVLYNGSGLPVWSTGTQGNGISRLTVQSDGNLVLYRSDNVPTWNTATGLSWSMTRVNDGRMNSGTSMYRYQYTRSYDKRYALVMQGDGNLVLYGPGFHPIWYTSTQGSPATRLTMQTDGNLVLYTDWNAPVWYTNTQGNWDGWLYVQDDGNLVIYNGYNQPVWSTGTQGRV